MTCMDKPALAHIAMWLCGTRVACSPCVQEDIGLNPSPATRYLCQWGPRELIRYVML